MSAYRNVRGLVSAALLSHPHIRLVELVGSRAVGTAVPLSDWDFRVESDDFPAVSADLPELVSGLEPLTQQWDRLSTHQCYMFILAGPAKVDLLFLDQPHQPKPPWRVSAKTLPGIDGHFWDWTLWLAAKRQGGKDELVRSELDKMAKHLLEPMGVQEVPDSLEAAGTYYRAARDRLESRFRGAIPRRLEDEVLGILLPR